MSKTEPQPGDQILDWRWTLGEEIKPGEDLYEMYLGGRQNRVTNLLQAFPDEAQQQE
jgi:hypothetical protein